MPTKTSHRKTKPKGQSSIELLFNYSWAFIIIAIVLAIFIYYISLPRTIVPSSCTFTSGVSCKAIEFGSNTLSTIPSTQVSMVLVNGQAFDIISNSILPVNVIVNVTSPSRYGITLLSCNSNTIVSGGAVICTGVTSASGNVIPPTTQISGTITFNTTVCISGTAQNCAAQRQTSYVGNFSTNVGQIPVAPKSKPFSSNIILYESAGTIGISSPDLMTAGVSISGSPLVGVPVYFTVNSPLGSISPAQATTGSNGNATVYFTASQSGEYIITATFTTYAASNTVYVQPGYTGPTTVSTLPTSPTTSVYNPLTAGPIIATPSVPAGDPDTLTAQPGGGNGAYIIKWFKSNKACGGAVQYVSTGSPPYTWTPTVNSKSTYWYNVSDTLNDLPEPCSPGYAVAVTPTVRVTFYNSLGVTGPAGAITFNGVTQADGSSNVYFAGGISGGAVAPATLDGYPFTGWVTYGSGGGVSGVNLGGSSSSTSASVNVAAILIASYGCYSMSHSTTTCTGGGGTPITESVLSTDYANANCQSSDLLASTPLQLSATAGVDSYFLNWMGTGTGSYTCTPNTSCPGYDTPTGTTPTITMSSNINEVASCSG